MGVAGRGRPAARRLLRAQPAAGRPAFAPRRGRDPDRAGDRRCGGQLLPRALAPLAARPVRGLERRHPARRGGAAPGPRRAARLRADAAAGGFAHLPRRQEARLHLHPRLRQQPARHRASLRHAGAADRVRAGRRFDPVPLGRLRRADDRRSDPFLAGGLDQQPDGRHARAQAGPRPDRARPAGDIDLAKPRRHGPERGTSTR